MRPGLLASVWPRLDAITPRDSDAQVAPPGPGVPANRQAWSMRQFSDLLPLSDLENRFARDGRRRLLFLLKQMVLSEHTHLFLASLLISLIDGVLLKLALI